MLLIGPGRLAGSPVYFLVGALAIEASGAIDTDSVVVLEVNNLSRRGPTGLIPREFVDHCDDPAMVTHCNSLSWQPGFEANSDARSAVIACGRFGAAR